jgi:hypothetical protein
MRSEVALDTRSSAPIVITGMHRSGTSLAAGLLKAAGVSVGERLLAGARGNIGGFFENLDFLEYHRQLLCENGLSRYGWTLAREISVSEVNREKAKRLVEANANGSLWGWKDPRTTLFLPFWHSLLPNARYVFLFRPIIEVADSLFRRGAACDSIFQTRPELTVQLWLHYNQQILEFFDAHPEKCLIFSASEVAQNPHGFIQTIAETFALPELNETLVSPPQGALRNDVYETDLPKLLADRLPQSNVLYDELFRRSKPLVERAERPFTPMKETPLSTQLDLSSWVSLRLQEVELEKLRSDVTHLQGTVGELYYKKYTDVLTRLEAVEAREPKDTVPKKKSRLLRLFQKNNETPAAHPGIPSLTYAFHFLESDKDAVPGIRVVGWCIPQNESASLRLRFVADALVSEITPANNDLSQCRTNLSCGSSGSIDTFLPLSAGKHTVRLEVASEQSGWVLLDQFEIQAEAFPRSPVAHAG